MPTRAPALTVAEMGAPSGCPRAASICEPAENVIEHTDVDPA